MKYFFFIILLGIFHNIGYSQQMKMKPLQELIDNEDSGWLIIEDWMKEAVNSIEILPKNSSKADSALYYTQVTTRSPMGAIIYETGGILVDNGWIRILGSGADKLKRSLPDWNKGKSFLEFGDTPSFLLIADDAIGGFFAVNGGAFGNDNLGKIYYFSPDSLDWEFLGIGYSEFIFWVFTGNLDEFYQGLRWKNWKKDAAKADGNQVVSFYPYLWSKYDNLEELSRKLIPVELSWSQQMEIREKMMEE